MTTRCRLLYHDLDCGEEFFGDELASIYRNFSISCLGLRFEYVGLVPTDIVLYWIEATLTKGRLTPPVRYTAEQAVSGVAELYSSRRGESVCDRWPTNFFFSHSLYSPSSTLPVLVCSLILVTFAVLLPLTIVLCSLAVATRLCST